MQHTPELVFKYTLTVFQKELLQAWTLRKAVKSPGSSSGRAGTKQRNQHLQWAIVRVKTNLPDWMSLGRDISVWSRWGRDTGGPGALSNSMLSCSRSNNRTMFTFPLVPWVVWKLDTWKAWMILKAEPLSGLDHQGLGCSLLVFKKIKPEKPKQPQVVSVSEPGYSV